MIIIWVQILDIQFHKICKKTVIKKLIIILKFIALKVLLKFYITSRKITNRKVITLNCSNKKKFSKSKKTKPNGRI